MVDKFHPYGVYLEESTSEMKVSLKWFVHLAIQTQICYVRGRRLKFAIHKIKLLYIN